MNNGALEVSISGRNHTKVVASNAHCDTLGLMVRSTNSNGTLSVTNLGWPIMSTLDGKYCVVYEEVGHGAPMIDRGISEFVTLDMGCVGLDLDGNEYAVSICAKDSNGPYDYELTTRLIDMAKENNLNYIVDVFQNYGSDVEAAHNAGIDCKGVLIGSGVSASYGMERTHVLGIENTLKLIYLYFAK